MDVVDEAAAMFSGNHSPRMRSSGLRIDPSCHHDNSDMFLWPVDVCPLFLTKLTSRQESAAYDRKMYVEKGVIIGLIPAQPDA